MKKETKSKKGYYVSPEAAIHRQIHYCLRKQLKTDPSSLPQTHEDDAYIAQYVLDYQLGLRRDVQIPIP